MTRKVGKRQQQRGATTTTSRRALQLPHRGARLARLLVTEQLNAWGIPYGSELSESVALVVAELATNAVTHGRVPGRDFEVRLSRGGVLRIEVSDARGERLPRIAAPSGEEESGRGLRLVAALASAWGTVPRPPSGKTVWAELRFDPAR